MSQLISLRRNTSLSEENDVQKITMTVPEALESTSLSRTKLYKLISQGRIDTVKIDGRRYVKVASLHALLGSANA